MEKFLGVRGSCRAVGLSCTVRFFPSQLSLPRHDVSCPNRSRRKRRSGWESLALLAAALVLLASLGCGGGSSSPQPENNNGNSTPARRVGRAVVATYHNDNGRTGVNSGETTLRPDNVNVVSFGRLAAIPVQGQIYAQPLYLPNISMGASGLHNLVIVATEHDQVYAIDVDTRRVMWQRDFLGSEGNVTTVSSEDVSSDDIVCEDMTPEIGITGTPVANLVSNTIYLVVKTKETQNGQATFHQRFHALDLATGTDKLAATEITSPPDPGGQFGAARFDPLTNNQRSALLLANEQIYVVWASHCDQGAYEGWLMSFDQTTLQLTAAWTSTPSAGAGGIWMSGSGPATDSSGDIFLVAGNGLSQSVSGFEDYGDSVVRLRGSGNTFSVVDYFTPYNFQYLSDGDWDLGATGPVLFPDQPGAAHPHLLTVTGKNAAVYLLDRDNLGHWQPNGDGQIMQSFPSGAQFAFSNPALWNNTLYSAWCDMPVTALGYDPAAQQIITTPLSTTSSTILAFPGAAPSISVNSNENGILWILETDGYAKSGPGILRAYDATDLSTELYDSEISPDRDRAGVAVKFVAPTVADGMVFVGAQNELDIYGLLP